MENIKDFSISLGKKIPPSSDSVQVVLDSIINGGIVVFPWGKLERKCFGLMGDSGNTEACARMNRIKARPENKVLAVNGYPELIADIAKIEDSHPLMYASERLRLSPVEVLRRCLKRGALSFIFEAREGLPQSLLGVMGDKKTVMTAGEIDDTEFDFYNELIQKLHRRDTITAGTSANRTTEGTYHIFEQEKAYLDLEPDIDLFVYQNPLPRRPLYALNLESCSTLNMTVDNDVPEVVRFGSVHPTRFHDIWDNYTIAFNVKYLPHRERMHHIWIKSSLQMLDRLGRTG